MGPDDREDVTALDFRTRPPGGTGMKDFERRGRL